MQYFSSLLLERTLLNPNSTKRTYHLSLSIGGSDLTFKPGDSLAVLPSNDPAEVNSIMNWLKASPDQPILDPKTNAPLPLSIFLETRANLNKVTSKLKNALHLENAPAELDLEDALNLTPAQSLSAQELVSYLLPLMPRFYSIASSHSVYPDEVHLLVAFVEYQIGNKLKAGTCSRYLCDLAKPLITHIPIYVQASRHFSLPSSGHTPIILIGPGTGVAPFRAFLQERLALHHPGKNWLFFGERNRASDFYYESFWEELVRQDRLRLDVAFSRDAQEKSYVQHKLWDARKELWHWIEQGAHIYVCGDASKMAKDVEATFLQIFSEEGKLTDAAARAFLKLLRQEGRYQADVY